MGKKKNEKEWTMRTEEQVRVRTRLCMVILGICLVLTIAIPALATELLPESNERNWGIAAGMGVVAVVAIINLAVFQPDLKEQDRLDCQRRANARPLIDGRVGTELEIRRMFMERGFKEGPEGRLMKRKLSFWKDRVAYYIQFVQGEDVIETAVRQAEKDAHLREKCKCVCHILFIFRDKVTQRDLDNLHNREALELSLEQAAHFPAWTTQMVILCDRSTGKAYRLSARGISVYAHGSRLMRKMFF